MRRKRLAAKALSVIMAISACLPMNSYTLAAYAAEKEDAVAVQEAENTVVLHAARSTCRRSCMLRRLI